MTTSSWDEIGTLQKRKIQAEVIAPIYDELVSELGEERAQEILDAAIRNAAIASARDFAQRTVGGTDLRTFEELQVLWTKDDALEIEVLEASATRYDYNVHRCRYAETYREMGIGHIGHLLSCNRDGVFCEGYDARIKLRRTQTLMEGAPFCDFRYDFEEDGMSDNQK